MTFVRRREFQCVICGAVTRYASIGSVFNVGSSDCSDFNLGSSDLDTRPPEMLRSTISMWVQRCPGCGYCSSDLSNAPSHAATQVRNQDYVLQLSDSNYPKLANSFLCKALIDEKSGDYAKAAWAVIHAAWVCDDAKKPNQARACRSKAVELIEKTTSAGIMFTEQDGADTATQVDLLRRAGRCADAQKLIAMKRSAIADGTIAKILEFQEELLAKGDEACHTIAEALRGRSGCLVNFS